MSKRPYENVIIYNDKTTYAAICRGVDSAFKWMVGEELIRPDGFYLNFSYFINEQIYTPYKSYKDNFQFTNKKDQPYSVFDRWTKNK